MGISSLIKKKNTFSFDEVQCFYFLKEFRTKIVTFFFKFRSYERSELQAHKKKCPTYFHFLLSCTERILWQFLPHLVW